MEITCRSIRASIEFYQSLGFQLVRAEDHFAELAWEEALLFLEERESYVAPSIPPGNVRVMVPDVDRFWQRCIELQVRVFAPIENRYYGLRDFTILDPDGFGIRFASDPQSKPGNTQAE